MLDINDLQTALWIHCAVITTTLFLMAVALHKKQCFHSLSAGFWIWVGCTLFFLANPVASLLTGNLDLYVVRLGRSGGVDRLYWILLAIVAGLAAFTLSYLSAAPLEKRVPLQVTMNRPTLVCLVLILAAAVYETIKYRTDIGGTPDVEIVHGHFTGSVNGWQYALNEFALFPITFLLMFRRTRLLGAIALAGFTAVRLYDYGDRFTMVAPFLAAIFIYLDHTRRKWPPVWMALLVLVFTLFLVHRGHKTLDQSSTEFSLTSLGQAVGSAFTGADTEMLPQFYLESSVYDENGFTYGTPLIQTVLFGWLPRNMFPWKDSLFNKYVFNPNGVKPIDKMLFGPKSSLIGNFYTYGSIPAVLICMALFGIFCRKLDGLIHPQQPTAVRALGFTYLSLLWLIAGSNANWSLVFLGVTAAPFLIICAIERAFYPAKPPPARSAKPRPAPARRA